MKLSRIGRVSMALVVSVAMGLGMTACGGGTIGFMWVLGTQYNQIAGFKIDDFTGNLTTIPDSPFTSGGANPVSIVVRAGGRFVFVVNKGGGAMEQQPNLPCGTAGGIASSAVGGQGVLTFQQCFTEPGNDACLGSGRYHGELPVCSGPAGTQSACAAMARLKRPLPANGDITVFSSTQTRGD